MRENKLTWKLIINCELPLFTLSLCKCFVNSNKLDSFLEHVKK